MFASKTMSFTHSEAHGIYKSECKFGNENNLHYNVFTKA